MTFQELVEYFRNITLSDSEVVNKFKLLGLSEDMVLIHMEQLIGQEQQPDFKSLANLLKSGRYFSVVLPKYTIFEFCISYSYKQKYS